MTILPTSTSPNGTIPKSYQSFWAWFQKNEQSFLNAMTDMWSIKRVEEEFLDKLSPKLDEVYKGIFPLVGMLDSTTAELTLSVNEVEGIAFVEALVNAAPVLAGWKFTVFKPATPVEDFEIEKGGCTFGVRNMAFYVSQDTNYPNTIAITVVHNDYDNHSEPVVYSGVRFFLDNHLGELAYATMIDKLTVIDTKSAQKPLIPISKLRNYLTWRQLIKAHGSTVNNDANASFTGEEADDIDRAYQFAPI